MRTRFWISDFGFWIQRLLLCFWLLASGLHAQTPAKTTVADTLYDQAGNKLSGFLRVSNPVTFTSADGYVVPAGSVVQATVANGAFSVALIPNAGTNPSGTYYRASYFLTGSSRPDETWIVPSSGTPVNLLAVRALSPPLPTAMLAIAQINPPSPCVNGDFIRRLTGGWDCEAVSGASVPTGTGFRHVTAGVEDAASKLAENADVHASAAILESKLALNFATHSNANDPTADQKAALAGTSGAPSVTNKYVTDADSRNSDSRTPLAHAIDGALHSASGLTVGQPLRATGATAFGFGALDLGNADAVTGTLPGGRGGTGNAFFAVSGPATALKTFTFPNADATMEYQANKNAASGYAGLTAGTKLNAAQGQEVWAVVDLSDDSNVPLKNAANIFTTAGAITLDNQLGIRLREATAGGTSYVELKAPAALASSPSLVWNALGQCTGTNSGKLTINASLEVVCGDDVSGGAGGGYDAVSGDTGSASKTAAEGLQVKGTANQLSSVAADGTPDTIIFSITNPFTFPGKATLTASVAGAASLNLPSGTAPSAPSDGDIWAESGLPKFRATTTKEFSLLGQTIDGGELADPLTFPGNLIGTQKANGNTFFQMTRFTDTAPTGNFLNLRNAAGVTVWKVDITGAQSSGSATEAGVSTLGGASSTTPSQLSGFGADGAANAEPFKIRGIPSPVATGDDSWLFPCSVGGSWGISSTDPAADCTTAQTIARRGNTLGDFAVTTSLQLAGVLSDETGGTSKAVFDTNPTLLDLTLDDLLTFLESSGDATCAAGDYWVKGNSTSGKLRGCENGTAGDLIGGAGGGANQQLSNLAATVAINLSLIPGAAGTLHLGSATLPWGEIFLAGTSGTPGTNNFKITGASTSGTRTVTLADGGSVTVIPDAGAANNFLTAISTGGVISKAQPAFSNLSGTAGDTQIADAAVDGGTAGEIADASITSADLIAANKTFIKSFAIFDPVTGDTNRVQMYFPQAVTITRVVCSVAAATSVTIQLDERAEATPNTAGVDVMTAALACDVDSQATTSFTNAAIALRVPLNVQITAVTGTPGTVRGHVEYTVD